MTNRYIVWIMPDVTASFSFLYLLFFHIKACHCMSGSNLFQLRHLCLTSVCAILAAVLERAALWYIQRTWCFTLDTLDLLVGSMWIENCAPRSACVYGCTACSVTSSPGITSTIFPRYITAICGANTATPTTTNASIEKRVNCLFSLITFTNFNYLSSLSLGSR